MAGIALLLGTLLTAANGAAPEWSALIAAQSEWVDRGISQTAGKPALQAELALDTRSGVYFAALGRNVDFGDCCDERFQLDGTLGLARQPGAIGWDVGVTWSSFPGASQHRDFAEYHVGTSWRESAFVASWTPDYEKLGREAWYLQLSHEHPLPWRAATLRLHVGYTRGSALHEQFAHTTGLEPYLDWQVGVARRFDRLTASIAWADTDLRGDFRNGDPAGRTYGHLVFGVAARFD